MKIIKTWNIAEVGWPLFDSEVRLLTQGRSDVKIFAASPGRLVLIEKSAPQPTDAIVLTRKQREAARSIEVTAA